MTRRKLNKAVEALDIRKKNKDYLIPGILGFIISGQQTVQVPGRNGFVYVRLRNNLNEVVQAYNDQVSPVYNLPVLIVRDETDITRYKVQGRDLGVYQNWGTGGSYVPIHGNQHSFNPEGGGGGDIVWVYSRQFMPLLVHPSGSNASPSVIVEPYTFYDGANWKYVGNTGTADLTVYKPTGSNARMVLIYIDEYGNPNYEPGSTYFNATITGTAEVLPYVPDPPTGTAIFSSAIRLVSGTSVINWGNIYDVRPFFGLSGTSVGGGGGGGAPTNASYVTMGLNGTLTDERVLTAGADITLIDGGAGGNATISVTTNTFASGTHTHPAGSSSIQIYEDSVFQVSGTLINFEDQLTVDVTGTTAHIGINQGAGSGLDADTLDGYHNTAFASGSHTHYQAAITDLQHALPIYDDATFKVTGTSLNFGNNLSVAVSGTLAFIDATAGGGAGENVIPVYNDNAFLITGSALVFNTNLEASASGTFVYVNSTAGGGGNNVLPIQDDSVFVVTGSAISFDKDLIVTASGTIAHVEIPAGTFASGSHTHPAGATAIQIYDDSVFVATGTTISFDTNLSVVATGTTAFVSSSGGGGNRGYFQYLVSTLEPDAIELVLSGTFSYPIASNETKLLTASWNTMIGNTGRMEIRNQEMFLPLRGVTLTGKAAGACACIINPATGTYANAEDKYYERMLEIAESQTRYLGIGAAATVPFLPGAYGAIVLQSTNYNSAWNSIRLNSDRYGWALDNEINDSSAFRYSVGLFFAVNKQTAMEFRNQAGSDTGEVRGSSLVYFLCPSTWSIFTDATSYDFRDDFMGSSLDLGSDWTRTGTAIQINTTYQWLSVSGSSSWGAQGIISQTGIARSNGKIFLADIFPGRNTSANNGHILGFHDGSGYSYTDFSHGIWFGSDGATHRLKVFENSNDRGYVGLTPGYENGTTYRVRITLNGNAAIYEIQGGLYGALGGTTWTVITPGTTSSSTTPLYAGVSAFGIGTMYVSDIRIY